MPKDVIDRLRHPNEKFYGGCVLTLGVLIWALLALGLGVQFHTKPAQAVATLFDAVFFTLFIVVSAALYRARAYGHFVLLGENQFPALYDMVKFQAAELGLTPTPRAFIFNANGMVNAFARRLLGGRFVFLTSALVEINNDAQVKFVIGHELGHHAAGHLSMAGNILKLPGHFVPFLGPAYSRGRELTCDRVGAYLSNDLEASRAALAMLACGCGRLNASLNCDAFEAQEQMVPGFAGWVLAIFSRYPRTTQRVIAVSEYFKK